MAITASNQHRDKPETMSFLAEANNNKTSRHSAGFLRYQQRFHRDAYNALP